MSEPVDLRDQFYIHVTAARSEERTRVLKHGDTFAVVDRFGDIQPAGSGEQGIYHDGTRFLSQLRLQIEGTRPALLSSTVLDDNSLLVVDLSNPDIEDGQAMHLSRGAVHVFRSMFLWDATCHHRLRLHNFDSKPADLRLDVDFDADFRDIFEVRGTQRTRRGTRHEPRVEGDSVRIDYEGLDGVTRSLRLRATPQPQHRGPGQIRFNVHLGPGETTNLFLSATYEEQRRPRQIAGFRESFAASSHARNEAMQDECQIHTSNPLFNEWLNRSIADLRMLVSRTDQGPIPYAGVPWYSAPFGRDAIITAMQTLWLRPALARAVLRFLASTQATRSDPSRDAEPGKILHEMRRGEMVALNEVPFSRYYGTVDATPLFVMLAGAYFDATGDQAQIEQLWPNIERALGWMEADGDSDGDGFLEYSRHSKTGLTNQGWKDSYDSVFHANGELARGPIALSEVQGYAYAAWLAAAKLARVLDLKDRATQLERRAAKLRERFEAAFWCEDISMYALALDGAKRPCAVRSSNAGHALFTGIATKEHALAVAEELRSPAMFSGWGIRTIAMGEARFNPMSYHNGSVWPHDNSLIARGFARYGLKDDALQTLTAFFEASPYFELHRMPELFCGFRRRVSEGPTLYPVACSPQAWASGSVLAMLQACLGMELDAPEKRLCFLQPVLPSYLDELELRNLRVGTACLDLRVRRYPEGADVNVVRREGTLELAVIK